MKITILTSIFGIIMNCQSTNTLKKQINFNELFDVNINEFFNYEGEIKISKETKIYFDTGIGYFITYEKQNNEILGSILYEPNNNSWKINSCYTGDYVPFKENQIFYVAADKFVTLKEKMNNINTISSNGGVTYGEIVDSSKYFTVSNMISSHLYQYSSSYLQETKILNVPNYMNSEFNNQGCVPTTAAMYYAYLEDNGYNIINPSTYKNLPLKHTDDSSKVSGFINYLGNEYFYTDPNVNGGTNLINIIRGYNNYLIDNSFSNYFVNFNNNYNEYKNAIDNAANPIPVSTTNHSVLGIGYKEIHQSNGDINRFIITNGSRDNTMEEIWYNVDLIERFFFVRRK